MINEAYDDDLDTFQPRKLTADELAYIRYRDEPGRREREAEEREARKVAMAAKGLNELGGKLPIENPSTSPNRMEMVFVGACVADDELWKRAALVVLEEADGIFFPTKVKENLDDSIRHQCADLLKIFPKPTVHYLTNDIRPVIIRCVKKEMEHIYHGYPGQSKASMLIAEAIEDYRNKNGYCKPDHIVEETIKKAVGKK